MGKEVNEKASAVKENLFWQCVGFFFFYSLLCPQQALSFFSSHSFTAQIKCLIFTFSTELHFFNQKLLLKYFYWHKNLRVDLLPVTERNKYLCVMRSIKKNCIWRLSPNFAAVLIKYMEWLEQMDSSITFSIKPITVHLYYLLSVTISEDVKALKDISHSSDTNMFTIDSFIVKTLSYFSNICLLHWV